MDLILQLYKNIATNFVRRWGGGGWALKNIVKQKNDYIFIVFCQNFKNFSFYNFVLILWQDFGARSDAPGSSFPRPPRYATGLSHDIYGMQG